MVGLPNFQNVNLHIGRRSLPFEFTRPVVADGGELVLIGVTRFAELHSDACEMARQHRRDFFAMIDAAEVVPVVHDDYPEINGFYILTDLDLDTAVPSPFHEIEFEFSRLGSSQDLRFESRLTGTVKTNNFSVTAGSSEPVHAPPPHTGYDPRHSTSITRTIAYDNDLTVYRDVDYDIDPKWSALPEDWYKGACVIERRDPLYPQYGPIAGESLYDVDEVEDIQIGNGMVRFWSTATDPAIFEVWDGTAWRDQPVTFQVGGSPIAAFDHVAILDNRPERCALRYELGESGGGVTRLDVIVVRGERGIRTRLSRDASGTLGVSSGVASTNTSNYLLRTSADANGHKVLLVTMRSATFTGASGTISKTTTTTFDAYLSAELSGAGTGNQAAQLALQYAAALSEEIRALPR